MATGGLYGSSATGATVAAPGSESAGLYGNGTTFGGSYFEWFIFIQSATQPATPTGGSWSFQTNSGTPPSGWSVTPPSAPTLPVWVSIALVNSRDSAALTWSAPGLFAYASGLPILSGTAEPSSGTGLTDQLYIQTSTTPETIWFKQAGTWTRLTGSSLYVDLTSNQTIAGTKTFSSQIQGSVSGTSANVTGIVGIENGGTGSTTAGAARTALGVTATGQDTTYAYRANNLSDLASASTARTNLGLGSAAVLNAGVANGVATLDSGGTVPLSQIPASIQGGVSYQGTWNATTNTPTLTSSVGTKGYYYVVSVAGSTNLNGITDWQIGDWAIYSGTAWQKIDNTDAVTSVNGYTGTVVLNAGDVGALSNITSTDGSVTITSPTTTTRDLSVATAASTTNVLCQIRNTTGATLTKGTVVYISGATGQLPTVSKAIATGDATSAQTLGMMTADLANNSNGYVTVIGLITNIDTSAYTDGAQLYLSGTTAGAVTTTKPSAPIHLVYVAVVEYAHPTQGKLFVKVQNGYELDEIHDVSIVSPVTGQTLVYNSATSLWQNNTVSLTAGVNGTLAIANGGTGQTTANAAFNALAPSQTGNSGKYLTTDGSNTSWATNAGGDVVGPASATNNGIALFDGTTGKLIKDSASTDGLIYGLTVGRGAGAVSSNTAVGASALVANTTGSQNTAVGALSFITNTSGIKNSAFGYGALYSSTGSSNTAIGNAALTFNSTGSYNTAVGDTALQANTTASNNTAVGYQAGYSNTTGIQNLFLGAQAGYTNNGTSNIAIGFQTLYYNSSGVSNVALGVQALVNNTTADNNTAVGYQAGFSNTTGQLVAVGYQALRSNTTGYELASFGIGALYANTTGNGNTAIGSGLAGSSYGALGSNTTGNSNTALGSQALALNTTASNNTAVGYQANYSNTTGEYCVAVGAQALYSSNGVSNTGLGWGAGYSTSSGTNNLFVGTTAGYANTTGAYNVALGSLALRYNTTASYNTAVGYQAGYSNTTGTSITAIGYQALYANTVGYQNTAVGNISLNANTTGVRNVAFGDVSLRVSTTGNDNSALGSNSLYSNTTGSNNTALGSQSLQANTTASNNTAVGYQAAYNNTTGNVTAIGFKALYSNTTGGGNVAVGGEQPGVQSAALYSNTTGIRNTAMGVGSLTSNTTGGENTAYGFNSMALNTTGQYNAATGAFSLLANTTGSSNTAMGWYALYLNTTAGNNTAVGYQAAYNNATGTSNTAIGYQSMYGGASAGGYNNTAIGQQSLYSNSSGLFNVGLGMQALYSNTTASNITAVGYQAGYSNNSGNGTYFGYQAGYNSSGYTNTFIGYSSGSAMTSGVLNTILGSFSGNQGGLDIRTASNYIVLSDGDGNPRGYFNSGGAFNAAGVYSNTSASAANVGVGSDGFLYRSTSALKYKQDVRDLENMDISLLRPVRYKSKCENDDQTKDHLGLIADEAAEAGFEELVTRGVDGEIEGFQYERLTVVLLKKLQVQDALILSLKARLDAANL